MQPAANPDAFSAKLVTAQRVVLIGLIYYTASKFIDSNCVCVVISPSHVDA